MKINPTKRKEYIKNTYSKYWIDAREKKYGFSDYDKNLINLINSKVDHGRLLDVAIGTGYPFAWILRESNEIYGIDIAPKLIEKCKRLYPDVNCMVGDCENLPYKDNFFNLVYTFHLTWYFPDLIKTISEMIRVTISGGLVIFDIQNVNNKTNSKSNKKRIRKYRFRYLFYPFHFFKQIIKIILHRTDIRWEISLHETPTNPQILTKYFDEREIQ